MSKLIDTVERHAIIDPKNGNAFVIDGRKPTRQDGRWVDVKRSQRSVLIESAVRTFLHMPKANAHKAADALAKADRNAKSYRKRLVKKLSSVDSHGGEGAHSLLKDTHDLLKSFADQVDAEEAGREQIEQQESDEGIERRLRERLRLEQERDRKKAVALKLLYDNTCMFCGTRLQVAEDRFYSEAAHIKGLGKPHNGCDKKSNMLVLCPNHHVQFDQGVLRLQKADAHYRIKSKAADGLLHEKKINLRHPIDDECVQYHHDWFEQRPGMPRIASAKRKEAADEPKD